MGSLTGRVAVITGAGRGIGREHALLFASEGAKVVVNDLGGASDGSGSDGTAAEQVVKEIEALGGEAVANGDDVTSWDGAQNMVKQAVDAFGDLHVLVNNAGILRDRFLVNMSEEEWDSVIHVHLKGHFAPLRHAAEYWKAQSKAGSDVPRSVINTSSTSGLFGNPGQVNYGAAKMGIAGMTMIADNELARIGVRVNAIAPAALTRLTAGLPGVPDPSKGEAAGAMDAANVSPFVAYLATERCPIHGRVFFVMGNKVALFQPWAIVDGIAKEGDEKWTIAELEEQGARLADVKFNLGSWRD